MATAQTAEQKAEADKAAAEQKAAEEKAAAEQKAEADKAAAAATPAAKPSTKKKRYAVVGPVAVIRTTDGSERYLYRNAPVDPDAFDADSVKHVVSLGLVAEVK